MQLLADYFPLILFFLAFKWQGIMVATAVAIVASIVPDRVVQVEGQGLGRPLAVARHHRRVRRRDADPAGRGLHQVEADRPLRRVLRRSSRSASSCSAATSSSYVLKDLTLPAAGLDARHVVVGRRSSRRWRVLNWYVAFHFSDRHLGQLQGVGRHRPVPRVRAGAGPVPRPLHQEPQQAMSARGRERRRTPEHARLGAARRRSCSSSPTTAPSMPATPARRAAAGTFRCSSCPSSSLA